MMGAERGGGGSRAGSAGDSRRSKTQLSVFQNPERAIHRARRSNTLPPPALTYTTLGERHTYGSVQEHVDASLHTVTVHTQWRVRTLQAYMACTDTFTEDRPSSGPPHERTVSVPSYRISTAEPRSRVALRCRPCVDSHSTLIAYTYTHGAHKIGVHRIQGIHRTHPT